MTFRISIRYPGRICGCAVWNTASRRLRLAGALAPLLCLLLTAARPGGAPRQAAPRVTVRINHRFSGVPLRMDDVSLLTAAGDDLSVSRLAYLVSDVALLRSDGSRVDLPSGPFYLNPAEGRLSFTLTGVPAGSYSGLAFQIGLEPKTNHSDPAHYPAGHPLNPLVSRLHWGWQGGYVFLAMEGSYTASDGRLRGYSYHLGNDANRTAITLAGRLDVAGDTDASVDFDVDRLFGGISPSPAHGADSTHSAPGDALAARLKSNLATAFAWRGAEAASSPGLEPARGPAGSEPAKSVVPLPTPASTHPFPFRVPEGLPQPDLPADNPLTREGVSLGRKLFVDKRLSGNATQSCASCHRPDAAFSDSGRPRSAGIDHLPGTRRTMPLFNLAWSGPYTWDGRRARLREQALAPIVNRREMHASLDHVTAILLRDHDYPALFHSAFGSAGITPVKVGLALEQYLLTLTSTDSKFDRASRGIVKFTDEEKRGLLLFITEYDPARGRVGADCFHCHGGNMFSDYRYANNGIDDRFADRGRAMVTGREADLGKFKTPSLRNVAVTAPYMHDGRFKTLEQVVDHYTRGVHRTASLDPNIAKHPDSGMALTAADKKALVAFLKTLTDYKYLSGARHGRVP